jgi:hypothetical protein
VVSMRLSLFVRVSIAKVEVQTLEPHSPKILAAPSCVPGFHSLIKRWRFPPTIFDYLQPPVLRRSIKAHSYILSIIEPQLEESIQTNTAPNDLRIYDSLCTLMTRYGGSLVTAITSCQLQQIQSTRTLELILTTNSRHSISASEDQNPETADIYVESTPSINTISINLPQRMPNRQQQVIT